MEVESLHPGLDLDLSHGVAITVGETRFKITEKNGGIVIRIEDQMQVLPEATNSILIKSQPL